MHYDRILCGITDPGHITIQDRWIKKRFQPHF